MATFRDLLHSLQELSDVQLDQEIKIIPTGYCTEESVDIDGYSPFSGKVELAISKGDRALIPRSVAAVSVDALTPKNGTSRRANWQQVSSLASSCIPRRQ